jgi:nucleotide-binding universal stress UspA family protein
MKTYQRILVPISASSHSDILLQRAAELAHAQHTKMLVVHVLDTRSGFESDGPAAVLPGEAAARRAPKVRKRLDLQLARNNLSWVEAKVVWGEPKAVLADVIRAWAPDLVVTHSGHQLPPGIAEGMDIFTVGRRSLLRRLAEALYIPTLRHA